MHFRTMQTADRQPVTTERRRLPQPHPAIIWGALTADLIALVIYMATYVPPIFLSVVHWLATSSGLVLLLVMNLIATVVFGRK